MEDGEQVLHSVVRLPSKQALTLLRLLLIGDVHRNADEPGMRATLIVQALAPRLDPADRSVLLEQPVLLDELFSGGERTVHCLSNPLHVLWMDAREVLRQRCALLALGGS